MFMSRRHFPEFNANSRSERKISDKILTFVSRNKIKTIAAHLDSMGCNSGKLCSPEQNFDDKIKEMADKNIRDPTQRESDTSDHFNPKRTSRVSVSLARYCA